jgi:hypothetical protein
MAHGQCQALVQMAQTQIFGMLAGLNAEMLLLHAVQAAELQTPLYTLVQIQVFLVMWDPLI